MTWLVFGGTSGIGRHIVEQAAERDVPVRAFGRSAEDVTFSHPNVAAFKGDALDADDVNRALEGVNVVVQALGVKERPAMLWEEETLFSQATSILLPAMLKANVDRLIAVTGYGSGDSAASMSKLVKVGHNAVLGRVYEDKTRQEALIQTSDVKWTLVRPTILTNGSLSTQYKVLTDPATWRLGAISRADVAHFVVECGLAGAHIGEAVVLA
ncbi:MAG: NAD(P)-binding oxidoreductase [Pseudomonadota bacterium]